MGPPHGFMDWEEEFQRWLEPFLGRLGRAEQRFWAPLYLQGLLGPGERKSVEPMAARLAPGDAQQLHHFVATSPWDARVLEDALVEEADRLVGGPRAVLIVDDTSLLKQGKHSVGVARQYSGELGKRANCQVLVSLTLAQGEVPVPVALRLYLPEAWATDAVRRKKVGVPEAAGFRTKGEIALAELDRVSAAGARFGYVLADAGYGSAAEFRRALTERGLLWAVGIQAAQQVYPSTVEVQAPAPSARGRPRTYPVTSVPPVSAEEMIRSLGTRAFRRVTWRRGTKGELSAAFAAVRVRVADAPRRSRGTHPPGEEAWLVAERRAGGEVKYYLSNLPRRSRLQTLARVIKARWVCEQAHEQMKNELGLDHYEGRGWQGLHRHALMSMLAYGFLQHLRLGGKAPVG